MPAETIKVLHLGEAPRPVWDAVCLYAGECHGLPNDSHVPWSLTPWSEDDSSGYLTKDQEDAVNKWAAEQGIIDGESFLFWMSW